MRENRLSRRKASRTGKAGPHEPDESALRRELARYADSMEIDPAKKQRALQSIAYAARKKEIRYRPDGIAMIKIQLTGVPGSVWVLQILFLALLPVVERFCGQHFRLAGWKIFPALSVWMAAGSVLFLQELSRHFSCKMAELEQSCFLNLSQLWLLRVCCISGADVLAVVLLSAFRAESYGFGRFSFAVYVLTPFFAANVVLLFFFWMEKKRGRTMALPVLMCAAGGLFLQMECPKIYEAGGLFIWIFLMAAAVVLWGAELQHFCRKMEDKRYVWN